MGFVDVWDFVKQGGVPGLIALFLYALYMQKVRWGWEYDKLEQKFEKLEANNDRLINSGLKNAGIAQLLLQAAEDKKGDEVIR